MTVRNLLERKGSFVPSIRSDARVRDVVDHLEANDTGALVVTDDERVILGIISERDVVRGLKRYGPAALELPVDSLMTHAVFTADINEPIGTIYEMMDRHQIRHVPITCDGKLCGIVTLLDVVRYQLERTKAEADALIDYVSGRAWAG